MVKIQLSLEQKSRALTLLEQGVSVIRVAADLGVTRMTVYRLKKAGDALPSGTTPPRKKGSGRPRKTSPRTDFILKKEVKADPGITALEIKEKHPKLLQDVAVRTVQHRLQKDLKLPSRRAAKKPLLTDKMRKKRLQFCKKHRSWTSRDWKKVMFSDESTFRLIRGTSKLVRRPCDVSRYDPKYTVKTVKHPDSVMVWGAFSGNMGRAGLYFLPKNVTMKSANYMEVLRDHMLNFWPIHDCNLFMHDGAAPHRSKAVKDFLETNKIDVLEWPGNSPDLNPIENAWNQMKNILQKERPSSIPDLKEALKKHWISMDQEYFANLATSMPKRIKMVIKNKGHMTKY